MLKPSPGSSANLSHLWDPGSHSILRRRNEIRSAPASDCLAKCSRFTRACEPVSPPAGEGLMTLHLYYQAPVSLCSRPIRARREPLLAWNKSGAVSEVESQHSTHRRVCVAALLCQTDRAHTLKREKGGAFWSEGVEIKRKLIPPDPDWRHDQRDWVSASLKNKM